MAEVYYLNVFLHLLVALFWLGGMFFLAAVGAPVLRKLDPPSLRAELFRTLGEGFRRLGWVAIAVLLVTGIGNLHARGLTNWELLSSPEFWRQRYGRTLMWKLLLAALMIAASAVHDFWIGPRAGRLPAGSAEALRMRRAAAWLARLNAIIGVVLVYVAVRLARGG